MTGKSITALHDPPWADVVEKRCDATKQNAVSLVAKLMSN
jgi:hypothetical protein